MSQCKRCGATSNTASRFCVACGAPLVQSAPSAGDMRAALAATQSQPPPASPTAHSIPWPPMQPSQPQMAVVNPHDGAPPSSSLQFAETAGPSMSAEQQEKARAAVKAVTAAQEAQRWSQQPPPQVAQQPPPHRPFAAQTVPSTGTGAMPGVAQDPELVPEGAPRILAGFFVSYDTQPLGRVWPIFQGKSRVGRQGSAPDLDMEIEHPTASTRHALVLAAACPGRVKIEDTGSTNGTFVNGTRLPVGARHELRDGDRVRFGLLATIVKII